MASDFTVGGSGMRKLRKLEGRLDHLAAAKRAIAVSQAEEAIDLIKVGFREETDPYGKRWPRRRRETRRTTGRKVLSGETSRLKGGWKRTAVGAGGFTVSASVGYASHHQNPRRRGAGGGGRLKRERRMMIPSKRLPDRWSKPLKEAAADSLAGYLTGRGV